MNFKQASLLTGLALTGIVGSSAFSPAQAVNLYTYSFTTGGTLNDTGVLTGSFIFDLDARTSFSSYIDWDINVTAGTTITSAFNYTKLNSEAIPNNTGFGSTVANQAVSFNVTSGLSTGEDRTLTLAFDNILSAANNKITQSVSNRWIVPSQEFFGSGSGSFNRGVNSVITVTATPVPFESNALPVIASSVLFGVGVWAKKSQSKSKFAQKLSTK